MLSDNEEWECIIRDGVKWVYDIDGYRRIDDPDGMKYGIILRPSRKELEDRERMIDRMLRQNGCPGG